VAIRAVLRFSSNLRILEVAKSGCIVVALLIPNSVFRSIRIAGEGSAVGFNLFMKLKLKKLSERVMVITGPTSGIGLVTARMAAQRGVRLVLAARTESALSELVDEIRSPGGEAEYVVADVGERSQIQNVANVAIERFGGFDTWVNNAGISIY
jgi:hypothetical protein